ncbi:MAG TPA: sulfate ABC transporter permease subunit CysT [Aggregatilineales bacterium]|nr:sulfate ABC transporter permease subunit CysT [Anaerolineales bacterium]HRE48736.1 sulfate ABC transporter permease subunit CysT [Aggregatilineales bacterium]
MTTTTPSFPLSLRPTFTPRWGVWGLRAAALSYLMLFALVPVIVVSVQGLRGGWDAFWLSISRPAAINAMWLSIWTAAVMAVINAIMGTLTAYVLVHYHFPGKGLLNILIDIPFSVPALVTGVMLILLYGPQTVIGKFFEKELGVKIIFASPGIILALLFIGYPFVVRAVQPVLMSLEASQQEAALTLGASPWRTFRRVIFPAILPAVLTGALLSFARALGEFGSAVIISGNIPMRTQTATVYVYTQVENGNMAAASSISCLLLLLAFALTLAADRIIRRTHREHH